MLDSSSATLYCFATVSTPAVAPDSDDAGALKMSGTEGTWR